MLKKHLIKFNIFSRLKTLNKLDIEGMHLNTFDTATANITFRASQVAQW